MMNTSELFPCFSFVHHLLSVLIIVQMLATHSMSIVYTAYETQDLVSTTMEL